eukprot:TRINITY_DN2364_c0_g1_i1.p1 TRINITY_DN2364_c0_g1~~TRINITY_DN2364_c0_g1_i1.p1  ORF type:complete len:238 (+),score=35.86 TRINITY_DN2364_c0_g1_i1:344-1057(+)
MYAFKRCVEEFNTQLIELDFRVTKDGEVVITHDDDVDSTTNGEGSVSSFTLAELQKLDAAYYYPHLRGKGITIPTFHEFLAEFLPVPNLVFMLDFKDEHSVRKTIALVEQYGIWDRIILGSVVPSCNALLTELKPKSTPLTTDASTAAKLALGNITGLIGWVDFPQEIFGFLLFGGNLGNAVEKLWRKSLVDAIRERESLVMICGADTTEKQRECIEWGVDFILTNNPDVLRETLRK